jgi:hypothetical protein
MKIHDHRNNASERGSALIVVVLLCAFTLILLGSYLSSLSTQSRITGRSTLQNEARNAAEGVAEYALAEMHRRSLANPSFGAGANPDPLSGFTLSTTDRSFIAPETGNSHVVASSIEFKNSVLSDAPSAPVPIDASDPVNADDPNRDTTPLSIRSLTVFAKASVKDPLTKKTITSYVKENVQVRDQTWFNYAIFYNMDMEFHAGPNFTVYGPVHTNANAYLTSGAKLQFFSTLSAVEKLYRYDKYNSGMNSHNGTVECISKAGMATADLKAMATTEDSRNVHFRDDADGKWHKFVQDKTFDVKKFNPPGMKAYVPEDFTTAATTEMRNNGYLMIEPQLSNVSTDSDYGFKGTDSENLKFSALSGFIIEVHAPASIGAQPQWELVCYKATDPTKPVSADNLPERDATTGKPIVAIRINPFTAVTYDSSTNTPLETDPVPATIKKELKTALLDAIISIPYQDGGSSAGVWGNGTTALKVFHQVAPADTTANYYPIYDRREGHDYTTAGGDVSMQMQGAMNVLRIDLGKLNTLLNNSSLWQNPYHSSIYVYNPVERFSGVVYAQFPLAPINASRFTSDGDRIRPAVRASKTAATPGYALLLSNAATLPKMLTGVTPPDGFTVATNEPLYIWGNYNADGNMATGSSRTPDGPSEAPALLAADAVTVLSANSAFSFQNMSTTTAAAGADTEVSAAIIAGLVPTQPGKDSIWSGGVHNLVRYLENWGKTYRYRGSVAVLFESEVAKSAYHEDHNDSFYGAPTRDLGYHQYLAQGRFPPATPIKRTVRRMNLEDIQAAEYNAGPIKPTPAN